jgi:hypothetical protein
MTMLQLRMARTNFIPLADKTATHDAANELSSSLLSDAEF